MIFEGHAPYRESCKNEKAQERGKKQVIQPEWQDHDSRKACQDDQ